MMTTKGAVNRSMTDGGIFEYEEKRFTKEEFLELIERNFPQNNTMENIIVITTVRSNSGDFQSVSFGKILE